MPCYYAIEREKHAQYVRDNRRTVNLYEGITDPVQILKIMHAPLKYDELIQYVPYEKTQEELYLMLDDAQMKELESYAKSMCHSMIKPKEQRHQGLEILLCLSCYCDYPMSDHTLQLVLDTNFVSFTSMLRHASASFRNRLLEQIKHDQSNRRILLLALAWVGDDTVANQFNEWRKNPPSWGSEFHVPVQDYSYEAGWELTAEGKRKNLFIPVNYAIEKREISQEDQSQEIQSQGRQYSTNNDGFSLLEASQQPCPWCGGELTKLLELDSRHVAVQALHWPHPVITIETCMVCSAYDVIFMEVNERGESVWSKYNHEPDYLPDNMDESVSDTTPNYSFSLSKQPRGVYHGTEWILGGALTQIGGHPAWIQDAYYPKCPCCEKSMICLGQIDYDWVMDGNEGIYYILVCPDDRITTTLFQQT
ncbi:hypothetical protein D3C77_326990 [compost metagenome]